MLVEHVHPQNGRLCFTDAGKRARRELDDGKFYGVLFEGQQIARGRGIAHDTLLELAGHVIGKLHGFPWASAELVYGLLVSVAQSMGTDEPWLDKAWEMVSSFWSQEDAKAVAKAEKDAKIREAVGDGPLLAATPGGLYHVRGPDGVFDGLGVPHRQLVSRIQELGMADALDIWRRNKDGEVIGTKSAQQIIDAGPTTSVAHIVGRVGARVCRIEDEGKTDATLVVPLPAVRGDLPPLPREQFEEIADYYRSALPPEQVEHFFDALAAIPMESEKTAAISITGPGASGKGMLGEATARLWRRGCAGVDSIVGDFQEDLVATGFVWIDETHGLAPSDVRKFAGKFRRLAGNERHIVNRKHRPNIAVERCYRVLLTANDDELLHALIGNEGDDGNDMGLEATSMRIARFRFGAGAVRWLESRGGMRHTNRRGAEWVAGDPNIGGMRLPRFILDLWRVAQDGRRPITHGDPKGRFLVRGTDLATEGLDLLLDRGVAPQVLEAIRDGLSKPGDRDGVHVEGDEVFVNSNDLAKGLNDNARRRITSAKKVAGVLKRLSIDGGAPAATAVREGRPEMVAARRREVPRRCRAARTRRDVEGRRRVRNSRGLSLGWGSFSTVTKRRRRPRPRAHCPHYVST